MQRIINYKLTETSNFIFHILAFFDFDKEWGPANLLNLEYIQKINYKINTPREIEIILRHTYGPLSFLPLNSKYSKPTELFDDLINGNELDKLLVFFHEPPINKEDKNILCNYLLAEYKIFYQKFWQEKKNEFKKNSRLLIDADQEIIKNYLLFLDKINPNNILPNKIAIYLIDALGNKGRGLWYGCAIGLPNNQNDMFFNLIKALHELTHGYSDNLLSKLGYPIMVKPTDLVNHNRKEEVVNYILEYYINNYCKDLKYYFKQKIDYKFIPHKIKKTLEAINHDS